MKKSQYKLSVAFSGLLLLACCVMSTHAQEPQGGGGPSGGPRRPRDEVYELRCRGGENAFQLNNGVTLTLRMPDGGHRTVYNFVLEFKEGNRPARADSSGLEPGTCSWIDQALSASEPRQIHFDAMPLLRDIGRVQEEDKGTPIREYFKDPSHFWSFSVYNTGKGRFQATEHKLLIDPSKVGVKLPRRPGSLITKP